MSKTSQTLKRGLVSTKVVTEMDILIQLQINSDKQDFTTFMLFQKLHFHK